MDTSWMRFYFSNEVAYPSVTTILRATRPEEYGSPAKPQQASMDRGTRLHELMQMALKGDSSLLNKGKSHQAIADVASRLRATGSRLLVEKEFAFDFSPDYRYGGTPDLVYATNSQLEIFDWKFPKYFKHGKGHPSSFWENENCLQVAAYSLAHNCLMGHILYFYNGNCSLVEVDTNIFSIDFLKRLEHFYDMYEDEVVAATSSHTMPEQSNNSLGWGLPYLETEDDII